MLRKTISGRITETFPVCCIVLRGADYRGNITDDYRRRLAAYFEL